jgi:hypothetical protein
MCGVEVALSHKYDWHVSSNIQIGGNQGGRVKGTRVRAPSARLKIGLEPYNFPSSFPAILLHFSGITLIFPCHTACRILKKSFYGTYDHARSSNKRNKVVVGVSHNYLLSVSSSRQS